MEPVTIAIICVAIFGVVGVLAAFIRQLLVSRDKNLNDKAQQNALAQEAKELEKIREQMSNKIRFDSNYKVLGSNKDAIQYIDQKIEDILKEKEKIIHRYAGVALKESSAIVSGEQPAGRKEACDLLKSEIDKQLGIYEKELEQLQKHRATLWGKYDELQDYLLDQEEDRNKRLDAIYLHHSVMLEKIYLRHNHNSENIAIKTIDASTETYRSALMMPIAFLASLFKISFGIDEEQAKRETEAREKVSDAQADINDSEDVSDDNDIESDKDVDEVDDMDEDQDNDSSEEVDSESESENKDKIRRKIKTDFTV